MSIGAALRALRNVTRDDIVRVGSVDDIVLVSRREMENALVLAYMDGAASVADAKNTASAIIGMMLANCRERMANEAKN